MQQALPGFELPAYALRTERRRKVEQKPRRNPDAPTQLSAVYEALEEGGQQTARALAAAAGLTPQQVSRRMVDLQRLGMAHPATNEAGEPLRMPGERGHSATVWRSV